MAMIRSLISACTTLTSAFYIDLRVLHRSLCATLISALCPPTAMELHYKSAFALVESIITQKWPPQRSDAIQKTP